MIIIYFELNTEEYRMGNLPSLQPESNCECIDMENLTGFPYVLEDNISLGKVGCYRYAQWHIFKLIKQGV